ncbi:MarR family transcriptional regulator [Paenibacillus sp. KS-LC4]|uniref:MarR family winged helix-turn-helix transcriptional regulator n=1 Tax=Paenibacillus sp. KS-LC4 TaxID=2979727 RepID=UPI0030D605C6
MAKEMGQVFSSSVKTSCTKLEILCHIHSRTEMNQLELQTLLGVDAAAVTRHLRDLKEQQLIFSRKNENDKRNIIVALTPQGESELTELTRRKELFLDKMTRDFSDEELKVMTSFIARISSNLK